MSLPANNTSKSQKGIDRAEKVSGRVLAIARKKKDHNELLIGSHKFGTMIVKAVLRDEDVDGITSNDEVQLSGKMRLRKRIAPDGTIVRDVLVMNPILERIITIKPIPKGGSPS